MSDYRIECIDIETSAGQVLDNQYRNACLAAIEHRCNARFVHNDRVFLVRYDDLIVQCQQIDVPDSELNSND